MVSLNGVGLAVRQPLLLCGMLALGMSTAHAASCVVLVHGLLGQPWNFYGLAKQLRQAGHQVVIPQYRSRRLTVAQAAEVLPPAVAQCDRKNSNRIDFVGHSLGGLLIRHYLMTHGSTGVGRVVLLGTPNHGTPLAEPQHQHWAYERWIARRLGPVISELRTGTQGVAESLGAAPVPVGIVAGYLSPTPWLTKRFAEPNDGLVGVNSAALEGAQDWVWMPVTHLTLTVNTAVQRQVMWFLHTGHFFHADETPVKATPTVP
jgi:pimeloyl-ACP methyl ester carboxylesterase